MSESARLEQELRGALGEIEYTDHLVILFEGQSWEWLSQSLKAVLVETYITPRWEKERIEMIRLLSDMNELRDMRNWIVHSAWRTDCYFEGSDHEECVPSKRAKLDPEGAFHFNRSRIRKWRSERQFTIADIE